MVSMRFLKGCDAQIWTRIMSKWILIASLFLMTMVGNMLDLVKKWGSPLKGLPKTSKNVCGLDYRMHIWAWKVVMLGWHSNSKCSRSWILWIKNSKLAKKWGPDKQNGWALIMQNARSSCWIKKLAKASNVEKNCWKDNYYDVQRPKRDNKVSKAVTILIDHALSGGLARKSMSMRWWQVWLGLVS